MARVVVLGAGIAGHTAALLLRKKLPREHSVVVVSPKPTYNWIPSNIWVGVGMMKPEQVVFELGPVYAQHGIEFRQARAVELWPAGGAADASAHVIVESTGRDAGTRSAVPYDYLVNATGPRLNFAATPGLGPEANSLSVCTSDHAAQASRALQETIQRMKKGERQTLVVGVGHGLCTCEGAAFEYVFNVDFVLRQAGVRDRARLVFLTNEAELGDFGVGGTHMRRGGYRVHSKTFAESLYTERGIDWITGAHVQKVEPNVVHYETLDGEEHTLPFDFAMLLPPFAGQVIKAFDPAGTDITSDVFAPSGFMKVDADYTQKPFEEWRASDWPKTYQSPRYKNVFAIGIAFAPPHPISKPRKSRRGTPITPSPPRTGMPSAVMARAVAESLFGMIAYNLSGPTRTASLAEMGASCVASAGANWLRGTAASMTMFPVVPDYEKYPEFGRDLHFTFGEIGSAGHWIKKILHYMFLYKARGRPGWWLIPE
ncbi:MAG TPA: FAD-dependent oxidoreductase [Anaeromyxobacteraceae bacterium]|nr:FAD-dependent oxidoreductase [Anaeromyxobacteraceae bacterium]